MLAFFKQGRLASVADQEKINNRKYQASKLPKLPSETKCNIFPISLFNQIGGGGDDLTPFIQTTSVTTFRHRLMLDLVPNLGNTVCEAGIYPE